MKVIGLIMAGGAGTRMAQSGGTCPKVLVEIRNRPLLEHNVRAMLAAGVTEIVVSVRAGGGEVQDFATSVCRPIVVAAGGSLEILVEDKPLGNIGCLGMLRGKADAVVVTYADNLTAINPNDLLVQHAVNNPAFTLAAHWHPFQMPFGELRLDAKRITSYTEKPIIKSLVCSAICVAGPEALDAIPSDRPTGLSQLSSQLIEQGSLVEAFEHDTPWIDVNDMSSVTKAEQLIDDHASEFAWFMNTTSHQAKAA
jgi:NDP-sugar pyrophosphorylase family protein